jgi:hypothetical protein
MVSPCARLRASSGPARPRPKTDTYPRGAARFRMRQLLWSFRKAEAEAAAIPRKVPRVDPLEEEVLRWLNSDEG